MNSYEFNALKHATAYELGCSSYANLENEDYLIVDGVAIFLTEDKEIDSDVINSISCLIEMGPINDINRLEIYQDLLGLNIVSGRYANASFGYNADKDCAVLMSQIPTLGLTDHKLIANLLSNFVKMAQTFNGRMNYGHR